MSPCPKCGQPADHVGVAFPLDDPQGEVQVLHRCHNGHRGSFDFWEPARDPLGLLAKVMATQAKRFGLQGGRGGRDN